MAHIAHSASGRAGIAERFWAAFDATKANIEHLRQSRKILAELNALTDRELADIGITKADFGRIARGEHVER